MDCDLRVRGRLFGIQRAGGSESNVFEATVDQYSASTEWQQPVFRKDNLPYGVHTIKVAVTGWKNPNSTGYFVVVDSFDVYYK